MGNNSLSEYLRREVERLNQILVGSTPEQRLILHRLVSNMLARTRRSQFKLIAGGQRRGL
jgi:hypothetical protein